MLEANFISGYETVTVQGLTQWDKGQKLQITGLATLPATFQVHFANTTTVEAIVMLGSTVAGVGTVDIPNSLLEAGLDVKAWIYVIDAEGSETIKTILFPLTKRTKPADFISEPNPTEQSLLEQTMSGVNAATANMQTQLNSTNAQVATKANQDQLDATNAIVALKANKSEVTNVMTPKGTIAYASLPTTGNTVGWYYYCPDGDGTHGKGNYVWNGTAWYFGGTGDEGYSILKSELVGIQNDMYSKKTTQISNAPTNYAYEFVKGKEYKINIKSTDETMVQVGTIVNVGDGSYVNSTPILSGPPINYDFIFRATENAHYLYRYKVSSSSTVDITIEEIGDLALATKDEVSAVKNEIINNSRSIYEFLGTKDSILSADSWSQGNGYISLIHSGDNFSDGAVAQKYVTAFDRVISYDFVPYANSIVCGYTQIAGYEYFWKQGYCISVNFSNKTLNIHNKYGVDSKAVSTALPSVNKSAAFIQDVYAGSKFRLVIERTDDRGVKATLYSLLDYSVLATISTEFEALTIPTVGLGYDYPAFTVLSGTADLYYLGIKIKYATNCHLYIVGDSLTEGVAIEPSKAWAYMVAKSCQNTVVSGRGGATINGTLKRIEDEANVLKPKYVMVMIGTNSGNTPQKLQALVTAIIGIGAIPIINCIPCTSTSIQSSVNADILALNTYHVRMDIATALNYDLVNGSDTSLFLADGAHLNATGYERMYKRVLIDCPFLFN